MANGNEQEFDLEMSEYDKMLASVRESADVKQDVKDSFASIEKSRTNAKKILTEKMSDVFDVLHRATTSTNELDPIALQSELETIGDFNHCIEDETLAEQRHELLSNSTREFSYKPPEIQLARLVKQAVRTAAKREMVKHVGIEQFRAQYAEDLVNELKAKKRFSLDIMGDVDLTFAAASQAIRNALLGR